MKIRFIVAMILLLTAPVFAQEVEVQLEQIELTGEQPNQFEKIFLEMQVLQERDAKLRAQFALIQQSIAVTTQQLADKDAERMEFLQSLGVAEGRNYSISEDFKTLSPIQEE